MSNLFEFVGTLPTTSNDITIYSTFQTKAQRENNLNTRSQSLSKIFAIQGTVVDLGDKLFISDKTKSISLYAASDSFWYQDDEFFASEKKPSQNLPNENTAQDTATEFMKSNRLLLPNASIHSTSFTTVAVSRPESVKADDEYNTEIHINFRYTLDNLPVFGPGAKSRVSLVDVKTTSGVYHFWRNTVPVEGKKTLLSPELALEILYKNFRFAQLRKESAKVIVNNMEQGYFAMSPTEVQNSLIPVYRVSGTVSTEALPRYDFDLYIVAVEYTDADLKSMGGSIMEVKDLVF